MNIKSHLTILTLFASAAPAMALVAPVNGAVPEAGTTIVLLGLGLTAVLAARHKFGSKK